MATAPCETFFQLTQNGSNLTGKWYGRDANGFPMEGTVEGEKIHLTTVLPPPPPNAVPGGLVRRAIRTC